MTAIMKMGNYVLKLMMKKM